MSTVNSNTQIIHSSNLNFREEVYCNSEEELAIASTNINFTNIDGVVSGEIYHLTLRMVIGGVKNILVGDSVASPSDGTVAFALNALTRIEPATGTNPTLSDGDIAGVRISRASRLLGIADFTVNYEDEYADFMDNEGDMIDRDLVKRMVTIDGSIKNYDLENLRVVFGFDRLGDNSLILNKTAKVRGEVEFADCVTIDNRSWTETYFHCELNPNGEVKINPREERRMIPFSAKVFKDVNVTQSYAHIESGS